jgi:hypothetical protein
MLPYEKSSSFVQSSSIVCAPAVSPVTQRWFSSSSDSTEDTDTSNDYNEDAPTGDLFRSKGVGMDLVGQTGMVERTFESQSNAHAMLTCGGAALAAHASWDPLYKRAQAYFQRHAVGQTKLSPVLISGLVGALVEAAFPHAVLESQSLTQAQPLIVGVSVLAKIEVTHVEIARETNYGFKVELETSVTRVRDNAVIANGKHAIWLPDYLV